jgi:hypothetical protein
MRFLISCVPNQRFNLAKLGSDSLWRYCRHFNLVSLTDLWTQMCFPADFDNLYLIYNLYYRWAAILIHQGNSCLTLCGGTLRCRSLSLSLSLSLFLFLVNEKHAHICINLMSFSDTARGRWGTSDRWICPCCQETEVSWQTYRTTTLKV